MYNPDKVAILFNNGYKHEYEGIRSIELVNGGVHFIEITTDGEGTATHKHTFIPGNQFKNVAYTKDVLQ